MSDLDVLLAEADGWAGDFWQSRRLIAELTAAVRDLRERHTTALTVIRRYGEHGHDWGLGNDGTEWLDLINMGEVIRREPVTDAERAVLDEATRETP